ncbi:fibronectin type III domain-containing protein, partial [Candidatus Peregrinibacteria bacterium]|nr:fibronectin type III domain-containing protein [Candidatus Peregrinibacteria bacterium]
EGTVAPGASLTLTAQSEPNLEEVRIRIQGVEEPLPPSASQPGTYTATVTAPVSAGSYPIDVILVDKLANKAEFNAKATVAVSVPKPVAPPRVEGLEGMPGDRQVTLSWQPVTAAENTVQNYRVYFGALFDNLNQKLDTVGAVTSAVIQNLENGRQYFFAVRAADSKGNESEEASVTVAVTPVALQAEPEAEPTETVPPSALNGIEGVSLPNAVALKWQPSEVLGVSFYKIFFGLKTGQYGEYVVTPDSSPQATVMDLINGVPYYFSVVALDSYGKELSPLSSEASFIPGGGQAVAMRPTAPRETQVVYPSLVYGEQLAHVPSTEKTGPEAVWVALISLFAAHFFYRHKRRLIQR